MKTLIKILRSVYTKLSKFQVFCLGFLGITIVSAWIFNLDNNLTEKIYHNLIYSKFRWVWDLCISWLPFPVLYLWLFVLLACCLILIYRLRNHQLSYTNLIINVLCLILFHYCWFYWTWGFNYHREPLGIRWQLYSEISESEFIESLKQQSLLVDSLRIADSSVLDYPDFNAFKMESEIRSLVNDFLKSYDFLSFSRIRCRNLSPPGFLLVWSTSGVYLPFCGESQIDAGLSVYSKPFTMAHELSHGMGWTHEGDCNLIAYLACRVSGNPYIRYAAELNYWRYLLNAASRNYPEIYKQMIFEANTKVKHDLLMIHEANNRYPEFLPHVRDWFYEWYLKQNGIQTGQKSYAEIIPMVINYDKKRRTIYQ
ncbi:MAG: DUF3810 family protein [Saprospiraceae bacterium]|nr:DUF3810 family protein [Saprospiraceae bacterium]